MCASSPGRACGSGGALRGKEHPEGGRGVGRLAMVGGGERDVARAVVADGIADRVAVGGGVGAGEVEALALRARWTGGALRALSAAAAACAATAFLTTAALAGFFSGGECFLLVAVGFGLRVMVKLVQPSYLMGVRASM